MTDETARSNQQLRNYSDLHIFACLKQLRLLRRIVDEQSGNESLWFTGQDRTFRELQLQVELRRLHFAVEHAVDPEKKPEELPNS